MNNRNIPGYLENTRLNKANTITADKIFNILKFKPQAFLLFYFAFISLIKTNINKIVIYFISINLHYALQIVLSVRLL